MPVRRIKVKGKKKKTPPRFAAKSAQPGTRHHAKDATDTLVVNALLDVLPKGTKAHPAQWVETPAVRLGLAEHGGVLYLEFPVSPDFKGNRGFALRLDDVTRYVQRVLLDQG